MLRSLVCAKHTLLLSFSGDTAISETPCTTFLRPSPVSRNSAGFTRTMHPVAGRYACVTRIRFPRDVPLLDRPVRPSFFLLGKEKTECGRSKGRSTVSVNFQSPLGPLSITFHRMFFDRLESAFAKLGSTVFPCRSSGTINDESENAHSDSERTADVDRP